ncbi:MAG: hypothetical protein JWN34_41 [Bryobacterales bacterium]|nr:hypothetical protein [Bryobacterales bacterium]
MSEAVEQSRLLLEAAALFGVALTLLYWFFSLYMLVLDRVVKLIGIHGAILAYLRDQANRSKWWMRLCLGWSRWYRGGAR